MIAQHGFITPSKRTDQVAFSVMDTIARGQEAQKRGVDVLYLHIGDPLMFDFDTPLHIIEAVEHAMRDRKTGYTVSPGIDAAIEAVEYSAEQRKIISVRDIFITSGVTEAIELSIAALVNSGDNVLVPNPCYPLYISALYRQSAEPNPYYLEESDNWQPDIDDIRSKIDDKTRGIVLIYPNNPTGSLYSKETLLKIIDLSLEHNLVIFSDQIYDMLLFDDAEHHSIASLNPDAAVVTLNGLSKAYISPGFRLGWGIVSGRETAVRGYCEAIAELLRARLCANHPAQHAIKPAIMGDQSHIAANVHKLEQRRDITTKMLNSIEGISCVSPDGAFYAFPKLEFDVDDTEFVNRLIDETGVITLPGSGFGQREGTHHFRIVFLAQDNILIKAYERIADFTRQFV